MLQPTGRCHRDLREPDPQGGDPAAGDAEGGDRRGREGVRPDAEVQELGLESGSFSISL